MQDPVPLGVVGRRRWRQGCDGAGGAPGTSMKSSSS
jgi:hypothetical protein